MIFSIYLTKNKNKQTKKLKNEKIYKNIKEQKHNNNKKIRKAIRFGTLFILNSLPKIYCDNKKLQ